MNPGKVYIVNNGQIVAWEKNILNNAHILVIFNKLSGKCQPGVKVDSGRANAVKATCCLLGRIRLATRCNWPFTYKRTTVVVHPTQPNRCLASSFRNRSFLLVPNVQNVYYSLQPATCKSQTAVRCLYFDNVLYVSISELNRRGSLWQKISYTVYRYKTLLRVVTELYCFIFSLSCWRIVLSSISRAKHRLIVVKLITCIIKVANTICLRKEIREMPVHAWWQNRSYLLARHCFQLGNL